MSATEILDQARALPAAEQKRFVQLLAVETDWLEDVIDQAVADQRREEPERPLSELLARHALA